MTVANENKIINNSFGPVEVKSVSVESLKNWKLVDFDTDFKSKKVGLHEYGFQMNQADVQPDGSCAAEFEVIPGNGQISFVYDSKVATQNTALDKENIANVVFTIGWSDKNAVTPPLNATNKVNESKMDAALQNLTGKITFTATAYQGEDGIDISENGDRSVIAVVTDQDAVVYSEGGVVGFGVDGPDEESDYYYLSPKAMFYNYKATQMDLRGLDVSKMTDMRWFFCECNNLVEVDLRGLDTSNITNFRALFSYCHNLKTVHHNLNTGSATSMYGMFYECNSLTDFDFSTFDTSKVENIGCMFEYCDSFVSIDFSGMDMSSVINTRGMFDGCTALTRVNLSGVKMENVTNTRGMFYNCSSLESVDLSGINMSQVTDTSDMFYYCDSLKTCYAKTQQDCNKLNSSSYKPSNVNFIVKPVV